MKLALLPAALLLCAPVLAGPSPETHAACLQATDYLGCVKAQSTTYVDQTTRPGVQVEMGNSCPSGFFYAGAGKCRSIECRFQGIFGRHDPLLAGKGHSCPRDIYQTGIFGSMTMYQGSNFMPASNDPACPQREPRLGYRSSCHDSGPQTSNP